MDNVTVWLEATLFVEDILAVGGVVSPPLHHSKLQASAFALQNWLAKEPLIP